MKIIKMIALTLSALFLCWLLFSWVDIVSDNSKPNPQHSNINFFVIMANE